MLPTVRIPPTDNVPPTPTDEIIRETLEIGCTVLTKREERKIVGPLTYNCLSSKTSPYALKVDWTTTIPGADKLVITNGLVNEKELFVTKSRIVSELTNLIPVLKNPAFNVLVVKTFTVAAAVAGACPDVWTICQKDEFRNATFTKP